MLRNIDYQVFADEEAQQRIEASFSSVLQRRLRANIKAFEKFNKGLGEALAGHIAQEYYPFITKSKQCSITNPTKGRCLYHRDPETQVRQQLQDFCSKALKVSVSQKACNDELSIESGITLDNILPQLSQGYSDPDDDTDCLVILGVAAGYHILPLLLLKQWKKVLIVEPSLDLLHASLFSAPWRDILHHAEECGYDLNLVCGQQGLESLTTIQEWAKGLSSGEFYVFKHYNYLPFNLLEYQLATRQIAFDDIHTLPMEGSEDRQFECIFSLSRFLIEDKSKIQELEAKAESLQSRFETNILAFHKYFPDIYQAYKNYVPRAWRVFIMPNGSFNLVDTLQGRTLFQFDAKAETEDYLEHYSQSPRLDTLDARRRGGKPSPFIHFKYGDVLKELIFALPKEKVTKLPAKIPSFIMYGCGMGYQIEQLLLQHDVDHYILYEPELDYFYSTLFLVDWDKLLKKYDENGHMLYLNIGDDGSNMFNDIHSRLQLAGINILSYTFFFVSYYSYSFDKSIRDTREKLRILTNISEYFDHSFFNITHTNEALRRNCNFMLRNKGKDVTQQLSSLPVFIIGNGPSLDQCVDVIRAHQDKAILISCGTSLKALYHYGIQPDFHAEVEQTQATAMWIAQVPDKNWLKQIDLLTVNGVHPKVIDLFNEAYICLKRGEAGSSSHQQASSEFLELDEILYSYPTVSNCALASVVKLGFKNVYLFGVDLGFKELDKHHSKFSAYYKKDGKELFDYWANRAQYRVKGNFQDMVYTKHEFKFSAEVIALTLGEFSDVHCYNCSDGAYLENTQPLAVDGILLEPNSIDKKAFKYLLKNQAYRSDLANFVERFESNYNFEAFDTYFEKTVELFSQEVSSWSEVLDMFKENTNILVDSYRDPHSLYNHLVRGSSSFTLTYLTRLAFYSEDEQACMERFEEGKQVWLDYLKELRDFYMEHYGEFDRTPAPGQGITFNDD